jgi:hypothetical protein
MDGAERVVGAKAGDLVDLRDEAARIAAEISALRLMVELVAEGRRVTSGRCRSARLRGGQRCGRANALRKAK